MFAFHDTTEQSTSKLSYLSQCRNHSNLRSHFRYYGNVTAYCHATVVITLPWKCHSLLSRNSSYHVTMEIQHMSCCARRGNVCFYCCNNNCHITMETPQTHCYAAGNVTLLWKCCKVHRSCYHGKPNMSQYNESPCPDSRCISTNRKATCARDVTYFASFRLSISYFHLPPFYLLHSFHINPIRPYFFLSVIRFLYWSSILQRKQQKNKNNKKEEYEPRDVLFERFARGSLQF
jgi:hypothetical protein